MRVGWVVLTSAIALVGGVWRLQAARRRTTSRLESAKQFLEGFQGWVTDPADDQTYAWLIQRSRRLQTEMGAGGICYFKPAGSQIAYPRYAIVLNMLPELGRMVPELNFFNDHHFFDYAGKVREAILRHIGALEDRAREQAADLRNPIAWIRAAVQFVLLLPLLLLEWIGLDRYPVVARVTGSWPAKLFSGALVLVATIVTILSGWDAAVSVLFRLFGRSR